MNVNASWYELEVHNGKGGFNSVLDNNKKPRQFKDVQSAEDYIDEHNEGEMYSIVACTVNRTILNTIRKTRGRRRV